MSDIPRRPPPPCQRSAFTLIETIIAISLLTVLMAIVWTMFGVYTKLETKGVAAATESALVRAIDRQLRSDILRMLAIDPVGEIPLELSNRPDGDGFPPTGFFIGSQNELRFLARAEPSSPEFAAVARVITYRSRNLGPSEPSMANGGSPVAGIDRLDRSWPSDSVDQQNDDESAAPLVSSNRAFSLDADDLIEVGAAAGPGDDGQQRRRAAPDIVDEIPELRALTFEYFDGSSWTGDWDSRVSGRLPLALRVAFDLELDPLETELPDAERLGAEQLGAERLGAERFDAERGDSRSLRPSAESGLADRQLASDQISVGAAAERGGLARTEYQLTIALPAAAPLSAAAASAAEPGTGWEAP